MTTSLIDTSTPEYLQVKKGVDSLGNMKEFSVYLSLQDYLNSFHAFVLFVCFHLDVLFCCVKVGAAACCCVVSVDVWSAVCVDAGVVKQLGETIGKRRQRFVS
jgi:hypothetical protein